MPTSQDVKALTLENANTVTTAFGTSVAGWATRPLVVSQLDAISLGINIADIGSATQLTFKVQSSTPARYLADNDDWDDVCKITNKAIEVEQLTYNVIAQPAKAAFSLGTGALSYIRIVALADDAVTPLQLNATLKGEYTLQAQTSLNVDG